MCHQWIYWNHRKPANYPCHFYGRQEKQVRSIFLSSIIICYMYAHCTVQPRFNLQRGWTSTMFVLNLAVVDLVFCTITVPSVAFQYFSKGWFWGEAGCKFSAAVMVSLGMTEWMSLGMIALSKCIGLLRPNLAEKLFTGLSGKICIASIWIYGQLCLLPAYFPDDFHVSLV